MTAPHFPAGWYPDPDGSGGHRFWDGRAWTGHRAAPTPPARPESDGDRRLLVRYLVACIVLLAVLLALVVYAAFFTGQGSMTVPAASVGAVPVVPGVDLPGSHLSGSAVLAN